MSGTEYLTANEVAALLRISTQSVYRNKARLGGKSQRTKNIRSQTPAGFAQAFFEVNP